MTLNWGYAFSSAMFIGIFAMAVAAQIAASLSIRSVLGRHHSDNDGWYHHG